MLLWSWQVRAGQLNLEMTVFCPDSEIPMTVTGGGEVTCDRLVNIVAARLNFSPLTAPLFALSRVRICFLCSYPFLCVVPPPHLSHCPCYCDWWDIPSSFHFAYLPVRSCSSLTERCRFFLRKKTDILYYQADRKPGPTPPYGQPSLIFLGMSFTFEYGYMYVFWNRFYTRKKSSSSNYTNFHFFFTTCCSPVKIRSDSSIVEAKRL